MVFFILAIIVVTHAAFSLFSDIHLMPFFHVLRPAMYVGLWFLICAVAGRADRPNYKGQHALLMAVFGVALYITVFVLLGIFFGFGQNIMVTSIGWWMNSLWTFGPFSIASEILRHRLIRDTKVNKSTAMVALVTVVFTFAQLQMHYFSGLDMFFNTIAPIIILNVILSYMAIDGTLSALIILRCLFVLPPLLLPILPDVPNEVWVLFLHGILILTAYLYYKFKDEKKRREIREPFIKKHAGPIVVFGILIAFSMGFFPIVPSVVLTDSMAGAVDRGSVALIRKTFDEIEEGDIIQFRSDRNLMVIHRVIEIRTDLFGNPYFITKGDANDRPDSSPVPLDQVTGVVFGSFRHIGMVRVWTYQIFG